MLAKFVNATTGERVEINPAHVVTVSRDDIPDSAGCRVEIITKRFLYLQESLDVVVSRLLTTSIDA